MRRSLQSELLQLGTVLIVPLGIAAVFPYAAFDFKSDHKPVEPTAFVSFVQLNAETERAAMKRAKSSLRGEVDRLRRLSADLSFGELPAEPLRPVLLHPDALAAPAPAPVAFGRPVYRPSSAAPEPAAIPIPEKSVPAPTFSRESLLKID